MYGNVATKSEVRAAEMRVPRLIRGATRRDRLRNEDIRAGLNVKIVPLPQFIDDT